jgi:hypothetical protein
MKALVVEGKDQVCCFHNLGERAWKNNSVMRKEVRVRMSLKGQEPLWGKKVIGKFFSFSPLLLTYIFSSLLFFFLLSSRTRETELGVYGSIRIEFALHSLFFHLTLQQRSRK